jgi:hypothetical protein
MTAIEKKILLKPDAPIDTSESPFTNDLLGFQESVINIASLLPHLSTPFTIGIYGDWGAGKTSYMKMLSAHLANNMKLFWFNAWEYENETSLLLPLLSKLADETEKKSEVYKSIKRVASAVVLTGANMFAKLATLNTACIKDITSYLEQSEEFENQVAKSYEKWISEIETLKKEFKELVNEICQDKSSLVLFIDDIDRCLPENVIKLIENIKHFLSTEGCNCIFVIGVDKAVLSAAIRARYGSDVITGQEYLEKIINLSVSIPKLGHEASEQYILQTAKKLTCNDWYTQIENKILMFAKLLSKIGRANPRRVKILITRFLLFLAFTDHEKFLLEILVKLIIYREFFPDAYKMKEEKNQVGYFPATYEGKYPSGRYKTFEDISKESCRDFAIINRDYKELSHFSNTTEWYVCHTFGNKNKTQILEFFDGVQSHQYVEKEQVEQYLEDEINRNDKDYFSIVNFMFTLNEEVVVGNPREIATEIHTFQEN